MDPAFTDYEYHTVVWAEWLESVRKDVERLFGALKQRFRWLSHSVEYHDIKIIGFAVQVASILQNRLLKYDNYDKLDWEKMDHNGEEYFEDEEASTSQDEDVDESLEEQSVISSMEEQPVNAFLYQDLPDAQDLPSVHNNSAADSLFPSVQPATLPLQNQMVDVEEVQELPNPMREQQQWVFKDSLRKHMYYAYSNDQIELPKRFSKFEKDSMPILQVKLASVIILAMFNKIICFHFSNQWTELNEFVELYYTFVHRNYDAIVQAGESMTCLLEMVYFHLEIYRRIHTLFISLGKPLQTLS